LEPKALFINGFTNNTPFLGEALKCSTIIRNMRTAVLEAGLTRKEQYVDPDTKEVLIRDIPKYSFHSFRHTFAVNYYYARKRSGDQEPWKAVQAILGHKSMQTTMDIYLRSVMADEAELSDALLDLFGKFYGATR